MGLAFASNLTIATVNNGHMIAMPQLVFHFEKANPSIKLNWITCERKCLTPKRYSRYYQQWGQFDIMTIGMYEAQFGALKVG